MATKTLVLDCPECLNHCILQGTHVDSAMFCPFCGENLSTIAESIIEDEDSFVDLDEDEDLDE